MTVRSKKTARPEPSEDEPGPAGDEIAGTRSVRRTCTILRFVGQAGETGVTLQEVAIASQLPKSSAHRYLLVLENEGFVERDAATQCYRWGPAFISLQARQSDWLIERARPLLEKVRDEWDETVNLGMLVGKSVVYLDIVESPRAARLAARRGDRASLHSSALGKAIAATFSDEEVTDLLASAGMPRLTERTITDPKTYLAELARVRAAGFAVDDRENEEEGRCVAVYIPGLRAPVAVSVSGLASRLGKDSVGEAARSLMRIAAELSGTPVRRGMTLAAPERSEPRAASRNAKRSTHP